MKVAERKNIIPEVTAQPPLHWKAQLLAANENTNPTRVCSAGTFSVSACGQLAENDAR
jgi:hypothetical protein